MSSFRVAIDVVISEPSAGSKRGSSNVYAPWRVRRDNALCCQRLGRLRHGAFCPVGANCPALCSANRRDLRCPWSAARMGHRSAQRLERTGIVFQGKYHWVRIAPRRTPLATVPPSPHRSKIAKWRVLCKKVAPRVGGAGRSSLPARILCCTRCGGEREEAGAMMVRGATGTRLQEWMVERRVIKHSYSGRRRL